jgi:putative transposase
VKYAFIERNRRQWPISVLCEVLDVSPSGYHQRRQRTAQDKPCRSRVSDDALLAHIKAIHAQVKGEYGWPRMWKELLARGVRVGKNPGRCKCTEFQTPENAWLEDTCRSSGRLSSRSCKMA